MKKYTKQVLNWLPFAILLFPLFINNCTPSSEYEKSMNEIRKMSIGASLVEKANPGFWIKVNSTNRLEITNLDMNSDAKYVGFKDGDIITTIDEIKILNKRQFFEIIDRKKPNELITMTVQREDQFFTNQFRTKLILLPTTLYAIMQAVYKDERVVLALIVASFNVAGSNNDEKVQKFKETIMPAVFNALRGRYIEFFGNEKNFGIVDRNDIEHQINELKLQQSGLILKANQINLGKMLGATHLLIADYSWFMINKNEASCLIAQKLVDVESGKVIATAVSEFKTSDSKIVPFIRALSTNQ